MQKKKSPPRSRAYKGRSLIKGRSKMSDNKCQGCQQSVDTMKDKKFYQVRIDGVFKKRCWFCKFNAEETARLGEYFQII